MIVPQILKHLKLGEIKGPAKLHFWEEEGHVGYTVGDREVDFAPGKLPKKIPARLNVSISFNAPKKADFYKLWEERDGFKEAWHDWLPVSEKDEGGIVLEGCHQEASDQESVFLTQRGIKAAERDNIIKSLKAAGFTVTKHPKKKDIFILAHKNIK